MAKILFFFFFFWGGGALIYFFVKKLEYAGKSSILKKVGVSKLIELKESRSLSDLQTVNPNHVLFGNIICLECYRLDYLFISNNMQKLAKNVDILNALSTNHSSLFCSFLMLSNISRGYGVWKFNNSLISNTNFLVEKKTLIQK